MVASMSGIREKCLVETTMSAGDPIKDSATFLELRDISKSFGGVKALQGVSIQARKGEALALLGENGAGKSTLIRTIIGTIQPDNGGIFVTGKQVSQWNPNAAREAGIACIFQKPALFDNLSIAENLALRVGKRSWRGRVCWSDETSWARQWLERVGLDVDPDQEAGTLSLPQRQLLEIVCALATDAKAILFDEPTASLTRPDQERLFGIIHQLKLDGVAIIYITHRLEEVETLSDHVAILRDGKMVFHGKSKEVSEDEMIRYMVGREMQSIYPPSEGSPKSELLSVKRLGSKSQGLADIEFNLREGEIFGLVGLVGAGRTELARTLIGAAPRDTGEVRLNGKLIEPRNPGEAIKLGIAYTPEDRTRHAVFPELSIAHNITYSCQDRLFPKGWLRTRVEDNLVNQYVKRFRVKTPSAKDALSTLSGGNQQKVSVAKRMASEPKLLILDEPTQGVDVGAKSEIHKLIRECVSGGLGVLLITSDLPEALGMCDRIGVMRKGRLVKILECPTNPEAVMQFAFGELESEHKDKFSQTTTTPA